LEQHTSTLQKVIQKPWPGPGLWLLQNIKPGQSRQSGRDFGLAWLGLIGPGLAWPTLEAGPCTSLPITQFKHQFLGLLHHKLLQYCMHPLTDYFRSVTLAHFSHREAPTIEPLNNMAQRSPTYVIRTTHSCTYLAKPLPYVILPITSYVFPQSHAATMAKFPTASQLTGIWCSTAKSYFCPQDLSKGPCIWSGCGIAIAFLVMTGRHPSPLAYKFDEQGLSNCWFSWLEVGCSVKNLSSWPTLRGVLQTWLFNTPKKIWHWLERGSSQWILPWEILRLCPELGDLERFTNDRTISTNSGLWRESQEYR